MIAYSTIFETNASDDIRSFEKPLSSTRVAILDDFGNMVPTFVRGQICNGGPYLFSGFQNRDDLTERAYLVHNIFGALPGGTTLCLGSNDFLLLRLQKAVNLIRITHLAITSTVAVLLSPGRSSTLETLAIGGEPMTRTVQGMRSNVVRLLNVYNSTETTVDVLYCQMRSEYNVGVVGKLLRNVKAYILNDQFQEVPVGSMG